MANSSKSPEMSCPLPADGTGRACERAPQRRLARDLFLLGLKETLSRGSGDGDREPGPPLPSLLGRALAGIAPTATREAWLAAGASDGR